jgi:hypothetical protein
MRYMLLVIVCMVIMYLWPGMTLWLLRLLSAGEVRRNAAPETGRRRFHPGSSLTDAFHYCRKTQ